MKKDEVDRACSTLTKRNANKIVVEKPEAKRHPGELDIDGRIILKWKLRKGCGLGSSGAE
jgi:hypothetical protein